MHRFRPEIGVHIVDSEYALFQRGSESFVFRGEANLDLIRAIAEDPRGENVYIPELGKSHSEFSLWSSFEELRAKGLLDRNRQVRKEEENSWEELLNEAWPSFRFYNWSGGWSILDNGESDSRPIVFLVEDLFGDAFELSSIESLESSRDVALLFPHEETPFAVWLPSPLNTSSIEGLFQKIRSQQTVKAWLMKGECETLQNPDRSRLSGAITELEPLLCTFSERLLDSRESFFLSLDRHRGEIELHSSLNFRSCSEGNRFSEVVQSTEYKGGHHGLLQSTGFRSRRPDQVLAECSKLVNSLFGPLAFLQKRSATLESLPPVYLSAFRLVPNDGFELGRESFVQVCAGKGWTEEQARMSAIGEAVERYASLFRREQEYLEASIEELKARGLRKGVDFLLPRQLHLMSSSQLEAAGSSVQEPRKTESLRWTEGIHVASGATVLAPLAQFCGNLPASEKRVDCRYSSNGCAAGSSLSEALLQGLLELIERDALAIWWYNRIECPAIEVDVLPFSEEQRRQVDALRSSFDDFGWETWLLDLRFDLNVPIAVAVAFHQKLNRFAFGFGCHLLPSIAVSRAFLELNQLVDDLEQPRPFPWDAIVNHEHQFLFPVGRESAGPEAHSHNFVRPFATHASVHPDSLEEALSSILGELENQGLETYVFDKSCPELPLSVVHVCVPGLRHPWPSFAPGRLFDVPVSCSLFGQARSESELNSVPLLI